jgi:hypothetical protein
MTLYYCYIERFITIFFKKILYLVTSDHFYYMIPLFISAIIGLAVSEIITYYWKKKHPYKIYFFDRRIHHGEIGLLLLSILSLGKISPVLCSFIIGCGLGLVKDDVHDQSKWFKFKKRR